MAQLSLNKKTITILTLTLLSLLVLGGFLRSCVFSGKETQKRNYFLVARAINWNGHHLAGKESNLQAFAEEIVLEASREVNLKVQFTPADPRTLLENIKNDKFDAVFTFLIPDSINQNSYIFSDPLYSTGSVLVVRDELVDINDLGDMDGKLVGVPNGVGSFTGVDRYPDIILLTYDNIYKALNDVAYDKIDGVILDAWSANVYEKGIYAGKIRIATQPFTNDGLRILTMNDKDHLEFITRLNDGLERLKVNGRYKELLNKWGLYEIHN